MDLETLLAGSLTLSVILLFLIRYFKNREPDLEADWKLELSRTAHAEIEGTVVTLHDIRNFSYSKEKIITTEWISQTYDARSITRVWFIVEPFMKHFPPAAHTFVSFEFADGRFLTASIEARFEHGQKYSMLRGLLNEFEFMYVWATESDALVRRALFLNHELYLYPIRIENQHNAAELFLDYIRRTNSLHEHAEFYNTLFNNCTNNIARHVNHATPVAIPYRLGVLFPGYSDYLLFRLGRIDTEITDKNTLREHFASQEKIIQAAGQDDFSRKIRV